METPPPRLIVNPTPVYGPFPACPLVETESDSEAEDETDSETYTELTHGRWALLSAN